MRTLKKVLLLLFFSGFCLAAFSQHAPNKYSALNGIWHITGARNPSQYPFLALSFAVDGDTVYGSGHLALRCSNSNASQGSSIFVTGKIAEDGSFLLTSAKVNSGVGQHLAIRGKVPAEGAATWAGELTIVIATTQSDCAFRFSSDFVATAYPALSGTYTGTINGRDLGRGQTISLQLAQREVAIDDPFHMEESSRPDEPSGHDERSYYTPLDATIVVDGERTFHAEEVAAASHVGGADRVEGDGFSLWFPLENGATVVLDGFYTDISGSTLHVAYFTQVNGRYTNESGSGELTRQ
jgi:hypothetical protein